MEMEFESRMMNAAGMNYEEMFTAQHLKSSTTIFRKICTNDLSSIDTKFGSTA